MSKGQRKNNDLIRRGNYLAKIDVELVTLGVSLLFD